jgi:predicted transcriptional regulator
MTIRQIRDLLDAQVLTGEDILDTELKTACGSDLMSDVLAFVKDQTVLLTGLTNPHVIRTAEMLDVTCIVFARGKQPTKDMLEMAQDKGIAMLATRHTLYVTCGKLYAAGLPGTEEV